MSKLGFELGMKIKVVCTIFVSGMKIGEGVDEITFKSF